MARRTRVKIYDPNGDYSPIVIDITRADDHLLEVGIEQGDDPRAMTDLPDSIAGAIEDLREALASVPWLMGGS